MTNTGLTKSTTSKAIAKALSLNIVSNFLLYIGHLIIARQLIREDYATFVVIVSLVSLGALFADLGLTGLFIRKFAEAEALASNGKKDVRGELLGTILGLRIGLAVIVSVVIMFIIPFLGYSLETRHLIMIMLVTFFISSRLFVVRSVGEAFLRGANKYHIVALLTTIDALVFTALLYFFSGKTLDLESAVWIYSFCHVPGFLFLFWVIYRDGKSIGFRLKFRFAAIRSMIHESLPFILSTAFLTIHSQADPLLLDRISTSKEVSAFGAGMRVLSALIFLPAVFTAVIGPTVTHATVTKDFEKVRSTLDRSLRLLITSAFFIAIMLSVSSELVMSILFGTDKYSDAAPLVKIFGWTFIPICFTAFITDIAVAEGKFWLPVLFTSIIMIISIVCDFLFIPLYGALGSAIAKCISVTIGSIVLLMVSNRLQVIDRKKIIVFLSKLATISVCSIGIMNLLSYLDIQPIIGALIVIAVAFYGVVFLLKVISIEEIRTFFLPFISRRQAKENQR